MATGTSNTELDELKEMVRQMGNRIEFLSAQNSDLNSRLLKAVFKTSCSSSSIIGQPLFSVGPAVLGHSSSLSNKPSPSVSS